MVSSTSHTVQTNANITEESCPKTQNLLLVLAGECGAGEAVPDGNS